MKVRSRAHRFQGDPTRKSSAVRPRQDRALRLHCGPSGPKSGGQSSADGENIGVDITHLSDTVIGIEMVLSRVMETGHHGRALHGALQLPRGRMSEIPWTSPPLRSLFHETLAVQVGPAAAVQRERIALTAYTSLSAVFVDISQEGHLNDQTLGLANCPSPTRRCKQEQS